MKFSSHCVERMLFNCLDFSLPHNDRNIRLQREQQDAKSVHIFHLIFLAKVSQGRLFNGWSVQKSLYWFLYFRDTRHMNIS